MRLECESSNHWPREPPKGLWMCPRCHRNFCTFCEGGSDTTVCDCCWGTITRHGARSVPRKWHGLNEAADMLRTLVERGTVGPMRSQARDASPGKEGGRG